MALEGVKVCAMKEFMEKMRWFASRVQVALAWHAGVQFWLLLPTKAYVLQTARVRK